MRRPQRRRIAKRNAKHGRQQNFAGVLQAAAIVTEGHAIGRDVRDLPSREASRTAVTSSPMRRPLKCALPNTAPPTVPGVPAHASSPARP